MKWNYPLNQPHIRAKIIGVILTMMGVVFLLSPTPLNLKVGFTSILIGIIMPFMITEKNIFKIASGKNTTLKIDAVKKIRLLMSEKITLVITAWILVTFFITGEADLETLLIFIFIGVIIVKELSDRFTTVHLKHRMNVFIYVFFMIFIAIIGKRIISI